MPTWNEIDYIGQSHFEINQHSYLNDIIIIGEILLDNVPLLNIRNIPAKRSFNSNMVIFQTVVRKTCNESVFLTYFFLQKHKKLLFIFKH